MLPIFLVSFQVVMIGNWEFASGKDGFRRRESMEDVNPLLRSLKVRNKGRYASFMKVHFCVYGDSVLIKMEKRLLSRVKTDFLIPPLLS